MKKDFNDSFMVNSNIVKSMEQDIKKSICHLIPLEINAKLKDAMVIITIGLKRGN